VSETSTYAYFEGNFVPLEEAKISIMTHAFLYGTAVFEGVRAYWNGKKEDLYLFRLRDHIERMYDSMKIMHLELKYSVDEVCKLAIELVRRNQPRTDTYVRPGVYKAAQRIGPGLQDNPSQLYIFTVPFGDYFHGAPGLKVQISSWRRVEDNAIPARGKIVGAYANTALAKTEAYNAGFDDCIMLSEDGHVSEGSAMNLFMVRKGKLVTTGATDNILEGITRNTVIELAAAELGLQTEVRHIDRSELFLAEEIFFTGTGAQITPVIEVDHRPIGTGEPGPVSNKMKTTYIAICRGENPKYRHWLTPVYSSRESQVGASHS